MRSHFWEIPQLVTSDSPRDGNTRLTEIPEDAKARTEPEAAMHDEVCGGCLLIHDEAEDYVWNTLYHEIVEYKLKKVTGVYRSLVNQLIEGYEKLAYERKERFIDSLPKIADVIQAERRTPEHKRARGVLGMRPRGGLQMRASPKSDFVKKHFEIGVMWNLSMDVNLTPVVYGA